MQLKSVHSKQKERKERLGRELENNNAREEEENRESRQQKF